ncbi:MAG TPA: PHP domain-containing protein [bacterium]
MKHRGSARPRTAPPPRPPAGAPADLHLHSCHSDGKLAPAELVRRAKAAGVAALALTDHDSVRGIPEAREACREAGILFVPGIELGVGVGDDEIHLLGYGIDAKGRTLQNTLDLLAGERLDRMEKMLAALERHGVGVTLDDVRAETGGGIVGRLHLAAALVRLGRVADLGEAFRRWIGAGRPAYVRRQLLNMREAIDLIREAGGVPVLAHPGVTRRDELIEYLIRLGVRGLEVYYPRHDFADVSRYRKVCAKFDLIATGGSDFHGAGKDEAGIGSTSTPPEELKKLLRFVSL